MASGGRVASIARASAGSPRVGSWVGGGGGPGQRARGGGGGGGVGGLLEVGELAGEERGPGKMAAAFCEAPCKGGLVRLQVDEPDVAQSPAQDIAIAPLERRAGDDQGIAG